MFTSEEINENLALSFVSASGKSLDNPTPSSIYEYTLESFKRSTLIDGKYEIVWGPAVLKDPNDGSGEKRRDDYVLYLAKNIKNEDDYRVAIRGSFTGFNFDTDIFINQLEWNSVYPRSPAGLKISQGARDASNTIIQGKSNNLPGKDSTLLDFISKLKSKNGNGIDITFTGHSLGGCLAMTLSLYYKLALSEYKNIRIHSCTFAAPTAGSKLFVDYAAKIFNVDGSSKDTYQSKFLRVFNTNDLVPCAWVADDLKRFCKLYDGVTPVPDFIKMIIGGFSDTLGKYFKDEDQYTQPEPISKFKHPLNKDSADWMAQVAYQHGNSYPRHYNLVCKGVDLGSSDVGDIVVVEK